MNPCHYKLALLKKQQNLVCTNEIISFQVFVKPCCQMTPTKTQLVYIKSLQC